MLKCECGDLFKARADLRRHGRAKHNYKCHDCNRSFIFAESLKQHSRDLHGHQCGSCNEKFRSPESLRKHQRASGHCYCRSCNLYFTSTNLLRQHTKSPDHVGQFHCCECDRDFVNESALDQHLQNKIHQPTRTPPKGFPCDKCERVFSKQDSLEQHKKSLAHRPLSDLECIDPKCRKHFRCPSSLLHHLESGTCISGMDRDQLNAIIIAHDTNQIIHIQDHPLEITTSDDSCLSDTSTSSEVIYTPGASTCSLPLTDHESLPADVLGPDKGNRCDACSRTFKTLRALKDHQKSPVHTSTRFHCPTALLRGHFESRLVRSFNTLSGLAQHLEAGACAGGISILREAANYIESCLEDMGIRRRILLKIE
jgi:hypothetical protein